MLWQALGKDLPAQERVDHAGIDTWHSHEADGAQLLILQFPAPRNRGDAYFLAALRYSDERCRVFGLEHAILNPATGETGTMISEFRANGRANWGQGSQPTIPAFAAGIRILVAQPDAAPHSFTPMRLA